MGTVAVKEWALHKQWVVIVILSSGALMVLDELFSRFCVNEDEQLDLSTRVLGTLLKLELPRECARILMSTMLRT